MAKKLNIAMKQFRATVRASGMVVTTIVFAENVNFATKILQAQFGAAMAFPQISRQLILSTMNQRGAYETNQIHSRVQIRGCQTNP